MATEIGVSTSAREHTGLDVPYRPSVVDHFMAWADRLPGPLWAFHLVLLVVLIVIANGVSWLDGSAPSGTFDLYRASLPCYPVFILALMHHLNGEARRALVAFRPALGANEADYLTLEYEVTTLPRHRTWIVLGLSLFLTTAFALSTPSFMETSRRSLWLGSIDFAIYMIVFGLVAVFMYHALRQLRMVSFIHASARNVNLFQLTPLYAFSGLTAQTGMGVLLLNFFSILTDPATFVNPALFGLTIFSSLAAVAFFVLPLKGIHDRIASEKNRLRAEANTRLEATIQEVYRRADERNLTGIDQVRQLMASLVTTREILAKIPTWPWEAATLTAFVSAFLLPLISLLLVFLD